MSTFYRYAKAKKIRSVTVDGHEGVPAYHAEDVSKFLRGELAMPRGGARRKKLPKSGEQAVVDGPANSAIIDHVHDRDDLSRVFLFLLEEQQQLGQDALSNQVALAWSKNSDWAYWFLANSDARDEIWATLGLLPLSSEKIFDLLNRKIALHSITLDDLTSSTTNEAPLACYLSIIAKPDYPHALVQILRRLLVFLCEKAPDLQIGKLYISVPGGVGIKETAVHYLLKEFYFGRLVGIDDGKTAWELDFGAYNPSSEVQKYQKYVQEKAGTAMVATFTVRERKPKTGMRNLRGLARGQVASTGYLTQHAGFRTVQSDDDIRAILEVNASHFGKSTRPEEDLLRTRRSWIEANPEVFHVLEVDKEALLQSGVWTPDELKNTSKKIIGFFSWLPLPIEMVNKLVTSELVVSQITGKEIVPFQPGTPADIFVQTMALHNKVLEHSDAVSKSFGRLLNSGILGMFYAYGQQGIEIRLVYARSDTPYGKAQCLGLGCEQIPSPPGVEKDVFLLDVPNSKLPLLVEYMAALQEYKENHSINSVS